MKRTRDQLVSKVGTTIRYMGDTFKVVTKKKSKPTGKYNSPLYNLLVKDSHDWYVAVMHSLESTYLISCTSGDNAKKLFAELSE